MSLLHEYVSSRLSGIFRPAQGILPQPFLVPGGIFDDELWDWDSFWMSHGVFGIQGLDPVLKKKFLDHALGSWINFFENQAENGIIPIMIKGGKPDAFGCLSKDGIERNLAKPVFAQFALELVEESGSDEWIKPYIGGLLRFYDRWTSRYRSRCGVFVWGSDVAIGSDNDPATYGRPEFSSGNLLLNCLFYKDLRAAVVLCERVQLTDEAAGLKLRADELGQAIQSECWDPIDEFFYSVDVQVADHREHYLPGIRQGMGMSWKSLPIKIKTFSGFVPLWCGIATKEQAALLVGKHLRNEQEFEARFGVPSLAKNERMYEPETDTANPSNWLGPIWIVANYMIYQGLLDYGYEEEALTVARKINELLEGDLRATATIHECYHPDSGKPNFNADFLSWNILALAMRQDA